jgi:hypothetical protein
MALIVIHAGMDFAGFAAAGAMVMREMTTMDVVVQACYIVEITVYGTLLVRCLIRPRVGGSRTGLTAGAAHSRGSFRTVD